MVVPPSTGGNSTTATMTMPAAGSGSFQVNLTGEATKNAGYPIYPNIVPLSARRAPPLDMSTVEQRGQTTTARETNKRIRPHGLQDAPTFRPTEDDFRDPMEYIKKIAPEGSKYGICKIIPPEGWKPGFAINTEVRGEYIPETCGCTRACVSGEDGLPGRDLGLTELQKFHFRTRRQELNSVEGGMEQPSAFATRDSC